MSDLAYSIQANLLVTLVPRKGSSW